MTAKEKKEAQQKISEQNQKMSESESKESKTKSEDESGNKESEVQFIEAPPRSVLTLTLVETLDSFGSCPCM